MPLVAACLLFLAGCEKGPAEKEYVQPEGFASLVKAHEAKEIFDCAQVQGDKVILSFIGGLRLEILNTSFRIYDCTGVAPAEVLLSESDGEWMLGGHLSGVPYTPQLASADAFPVYVYYDSLTLYVYVSNGKMLKFRSMALMQRIPSVRIYTEGQAPILDKKTYVPGTITVSDPELLYSDVPEFTAEMGIRGRGNSTWDFPKKPWKVKLTEKASLLGMPADKEWCLLANYADRTLIRNIVAMRLSEICGFSWTPRMCSVEVYLNDKYQGVYTFSEHKKVSSGRVNIDIAGAADNSGDAMTGGYYFEIEQQQDAETCWWTSMSVPMMFKEPKIPTQAQLSYVKGYFNDFEKSLYSSDFADPEKGYAKFIDVESFVNYYIVQELTKNIDGNLRKSTFITKERGKKLEMYHLWDFDLTMGACGCFPWEIGGGPEKFWVRDYTPANYRGDNWFGLMFRDPAFVKRVQERWNELLPQLRTIPNYIDEQVFILEDAQKRNFEVWNIKESVGWAMFPSRGSYENEVEYLKDFYLKRLEWLDGQLALL